MVGLPIVIAYFHEGGCHRQARGGRFEASTFNLRDTIVYLDSNSAFQERWN
jgi:hypothetical protein